MFWIIFSFPLSGFSLYMITFTSFWSRDIPFMITFSRLMSGVSHFIITFSPLWSGVTHFMITFTRLMSGGCFVWITSSFPLSGFRLFWITSTHSQITPFEINAPNPASKLHENTKSQGASVLSWLSRYIGIHLVVLGVS